MYHVLYLYQQQGTISGSSGSTSAGSSGSISTTFTAHTTPATATHKQKRNNNHNQNISNNTMLTTLTRTITRTTNVICRFCSWHISTSDSLAKKAFGSPKILAHSSGNGFSVFQRDRKSRATRKRKKAHQQMFIAPNISQVCIAVLLTIFHWPVNSWNKMEVLQILHQTQAALAPNIC